MKNRFNSYDIICMVSELQRLVGMRVNQVYDIDNKTYVIRLQRSEEKVVLLLESGSRFHTTQFDWPKNVAPSGFTMKLRKHLKNKRLEKLCQLGVDRIVDLQFGSGEAAYHIIMELYDRGNIVLTDHELTILNVLRPHIEADKVRFAVKEKYPLDRVKTSYEVPNEEALKEILANAKPGDTLKKILNPKLEFGSAVIDHVLLENGLAGNMKVTKDPNKGFELERDFDKLVTALKQAEQMFVDVKNQDVKGYIIQKKEEWPDSEGSNASNYLLTNQEFHPLLFAQFKSHPFSTHETFDRAVDEFFSALEGQKIDLKTLQIEREAMKKLANVRKDHEKRLSALQSVQAVDRRAAEMVARNHRLVDSARLAVQTALANQMSWDDIKFLVKSAQDNKDPVAMSIKHLKLNTNHITMLLKDPYHDLSDGEESTEERLDPMLVDIDLSLTAFANSRRYYDQKRNAAKKQQKTIESAGKALKSAERKTKQTLKEANTISNISKARKTYWFEKFYWFISSDNYLVIAGRDQQQNEMLVKRYMRSGDIYVHAEVAGASSVVVKNPHDSPVPPKTLSEAGQAAVAYSVAWEAKVMTRAWWVYAHQVSKSAPTGEYLSTGSFMIRGRKNYLLPEHLQFGFSFMFRLEEGSIERHRDERKAAVVDNDVSEVSQDQDQDIEIVVSDGDDDEPSEKEESSIDSPHRTITTIKEENLPLDTVIDGNTAIKHIGDDKLNKTEKTEPIEDEEKSGEEKGIEEEETENVIRKEIQKQKDVEHKIDVNKVDNKEVKWIEVRDKEEGSEKETGDMSKREKESEEQTIEVEKDDEEYSDSDSDADGVLHTHIKIDHETGKVFTKTRTTSEMSDKSEDKPMSFPALPKRRGKKPAKKEVDKETVMPEKANGPKRGQKSKLKKIKNKYRDQDEEDKSMRLELLKPRNPEKSSKKAEKAAKNVAKANRSNPKSKIPQPAPLILEHESDGEDAAPDPETENTGVDASTDMLSQLTGCPCEEDELLFAVPVVAPYSAVLNYKYKVKLMPGTNKRGKAAKTAVQVFLRDKACSAREKDLLKAVKEENIARNFPGKVKLSAPQLHKHKK